jgi:hypothetical protein
LTGGCGTVNAEGQYSNTKQQVQWFDTNIVYQHCINSNYAYNNWSYRYWNGNRITCRFAAWASNTITISGTPTVSGTFNYSIPLTGLWTVKNATEVSSYTKQHCRCSKFNTTLCNTALTAITLQQLEIQVWNCNRITSRLPNSCMGIKYNYN